MIFINIEDINEESSQCSSKHLSNIKLELPLFYGNLGFYDYVAWEREVEFLFYSYGVREGEKFQLVLKSFSYVVKVW